MKSNKFYLNVLVIFFASCLVANSYSAKAQDKIDVIESTAKFPAFGETILKVKL